MIDNKPFAMFFNASPRKGWNTAKMLEAAKVGAEEAGAKLDKAIPLFVQNEDEVAVMKRSGFKDVQMFTDNGEEYSL